MSAPDLLNIETPPEWMAEGLCAQVDPELWFPEKGGPTRQAKAVCARCAVRPECLAYALAHDDRFGVWGGVSERDRRRMTRTARARVPDRRTGLVRQLATRLTDPEIAARLECSPRTVLRIRIAAGIPAARPTGHHRAGAA